MADLNNVDHLDIIFGNWEKNHRIFLQLKAKSGRHFRNVSSALFVHPSPIRTVIVADFDNDMQTDIFMINILKNNDSQSNSLFGVIIMTDANITIVERDCGEVIAKGWLRYRCTYTDVNGDGVPDVFISHGESSEQPLTFYSAK